MWGGGYRDTVPLTIKECMGRRKIISCNESQNICPAVLGYLKEALPRNSFEFANYFVGAEIFANKRLRTENYSAELNFAVEYCINA